MLANELHNMLNRQPSLREHAVLGHHGVSRKEKGKGMPHARPDLQFDLNPGTAHALCHEHCVPAHPFLGSREQEGWGKTAYIRIERRHQRIAGIYCTVVGV